MKLAIQQPLRIPSSWTTVKDLAESGMVPSTPTAGQRTLKIAMAWGFRYYRHFCRTHHLDESSLSVLNKINFLQFEFQVKGKQFRTINTYRSAVSSTLDTCPALGEPVGQDHLVCWIMHLKKLRHNTERKFWLSSKMWMVEGADHDHRLWLGTCSLWGPLPW